MKRRDGPRQNMGLLTQARRCERGIVSGEGESEEKKSDLIFLLAKHISLLCNKSCRGTLEIKKP